MTLLHKLGIPLSPILPLGHLSARDWLWKIKKVFLIIIVHRRRPHTPDAGVPRRRIL